MNSTGGGPINAEQRPSAQTNPSNIENGAAAADVPVALAAPGNLPLRQASAALFGLFFWLLWGDFSLYIMESVLPNVLPLKIKALGGGATLTSILISGIPSAVSLFWNPFLATWSDRYRSPIGRRIPFLRVGTPLIVGILVLLGFCDPLGLLLQRATGGALPATVSTLAVIAFLVLLFHVSNSLVYLMYFTLFNDVVPPEWMGRFAVMFRIGSTSAGALFNILLFQYAESHYRELLLGVAGVYGVSYGMMCFKVREGPYPPPPARPAPGKRSLFTSIAAYFRECFFHRCYWYIFLSSGLGTIAGAMAPFFLLMNRSLGLELKQIGWINGSAGLLSLPVLFLTAGFIDRLNILRLVWWMKLVEASVVMGFMVFLFVDMSPRQVLYLTVGLNVAWLAVRAVLLVAGVPMTMRLLPRLAYAQFTSALHVVNGVCGILGAVLAGLFIDGMRATHAHGAGGADFGYRYAPLWAGLFSFFSALLHYRVYRWVIHTHGEDLSTYVPPTLGDGR